MNSTTLQAPPTDSVVRKIQLLLNLGSRSEGNEAEAAAAMARAQELLAKYNLDLATVQDKVVEGGTAAREAESRRDYAKSNRSAMYKWQQKLVRTIAETNYCVYWVEEVQELKYVPPSKRDSSSRMRYADYDEQGRTKLWVKRHKVLGTLVNTTGVMIMVDYLLDTIERLLPYPQKDRLSSQANLWREGCADRLCERIQTKAESMKKADYATQGEAVYTTAIQVADLVRKEEIGNYEFVHGVGSWARKVARDRELEEYWSDENVARREAERAAADLAKRNALLASETPAERERREKREAKEAEQQRRADERYSRQYWAHEDRKADREQRRKNSEAYRAGHKKGAEIGLDAQVSRGKETKNLQGGNN